MYARNTDPSTSHEAARKFRVEHLREKMLQLIQAGGENGVIWDDLRDGFDGVQETSLSPRIKELETAGLVYRNGDKRVGRSGTRQLVIRACALWNGA